MRYGREFKCSDPVSKPKGTVGSIAPTVLFGLETGSRYAES